MNTRTTSICKDPNVAKYLHHLRDKYVVVPIDNSLTISFLCVNHITFVCICLIDEFGIGNTIYTAREEATLHIPRERKSWIIIDLLCVPLEFQPQMENWIYRHSTGFLSYTSVHTNSVILLGLPNTPPKPPS